MTAERVLGSIQVSRDGPPKGRVLLAIPLARLGAWLATAALAAGAATLGFRVSAGEGGLDRLLHPASHAAQSAAVYVEVPEQIVNLHPASRTRLLKIAVTLAVPEVERARVQAAEPKVVDVLQTYLRQLDDTDLNGTAGLLGIRSEIRRRLTLLLGEGAVSDVLLRSILTQ